MSQVFVVTELWSGGWLSDMHGEWNIGVVTSLALAEELVSKRHPHLVVTEREEKEGGWILHCSAPDWIKQARTSCTGLKFDHSSSIQATSRHSRFPNSMTGTKTATSTTQKTKEANHELRPSPAAGWRSSSEHAIRC
jgi:hypothetical protein